MLSLCITCSRNSKYYITTVLECLNTLYYAQYIDKKWGTSSQISQVIEQRYNLIKGFQIINMKLRRLIIYILVCVLLWNIIFPLYKETKSIIVPPYFFYRIWSNLFSRLSNVSYGYNINPVRTHCFQKHILYYILYETSFQKLIFSPFISV